MAKYQKDKKPFFAFFSQQKIKKSPSSNWFLKLYTCVYIRVHQTRNDNNILNSIATNSTAGQS